MSSDNSINYRGGKLAVGSLTFEEITGATPSYLYFKNRLTTKVDDMRDLLDDCVGLKYAVKANPFPPLLELLSSSVQGFDVASTGEIDLVHRMTDPTHISFSGPAKSYKELAYALDRRIVINLESKGEVERLARAAKEMGVSPKVCVRINPPFQLASKGLAMGGVASQFGIDLEQLPTVFKNWPKEFEFSGYHVFGGSQCLNASHLAQYYNRVADLVISLKDISPGPIKFANIGASVGIPYFHHDKPLDFATVANSFNSVVRKIESNLDGCSIQYEMGRYIVGEMGFFATRVIEVKESRKKLFAICDGGLNCHLAATGNFGQVIKRNYPIFNASRVGNATEVTVVGPLCTPLDTLASNALLAKPQPGDLIVIAQSGAYGASASPSGFLSREKVFEKLC